MWLLVTGHQARPLMTFSYYCIAAITLSDSLQIISLCRRSRTILEPLGIYKGGHPVLYPALRCAPVRSHLQRSHARRHEKNAQHRGELHGRLRALNRILGGVEVDLA